MLRPLPGSCPRGSAAAHRPAAPRLEAVGGGPLPGLARPCHCHRVVTAPPVALVQPLALGTVLLGRIKPPALGQPKVARLQPSRRRGELLSLGAEPSPVPTSDPRTTHSSPCTAPAAPDLSAAVASTSPSQALSTAESRGRPVQRPQGRGQAERWHCRAPGAPVARSRRRRRDRELGVGPSPWNGVSS